MDGFLSNITIFGSPVAVLLGYVAVALRQNFILKKIDSLERFMRSCQVERREVESTLHSRITSLSDRTAKLEGWKNGLSQ